MEERYHPDVFVGDAALWWLDQRQSEAPLFLQIGFPGPHPPYDPVARHIEPYLSADVPTPHVSDEDLSGQPPAHRGLREEMVRGNHDAVAWKARPTPDQFRRLRTHYAANVSMIDEKIGQILAKLEEKGYLENAIVIFTSDHGDCLGDHGHIQKWTMYDCVTRVPVILWSPGRFEAGARIDALTQQMDIAPTILEAAGLDTPGDWETRPVPGLARGAEEREYVFAEHIRDNLLQAVDYITMVRTREWKLVHYLDQDCGELYDLSADPGELNNLWSAAAHDARKRALLDVILNWRVRSAIQHKLAGDAGQPPPPPRKAHP